VKVWLTPWARWFRKLMESGWKADQVGAISVSQWFSIMQSDGAGSENVTTFRTKAEWVAFVNKRRAKKGLPPLSTDQPQASAHPPEKENDVKESDIKAGAKVHTPHGPGEVSGRDGDAWKVKRADGTEKSYHAWDLRPVVERKAKPE
jgi:hypothetical protein